LIPKKGLRFFSSPQHLHWLWGSQSLLFSRHSVLCLQE